MPKPLEIDVERIPWEIPLRIAHSLQGIVSINMIHVGKWSCTLALLRESEKLLNNGQFLLLYGSFKICNKHKSESNYFFDNSLKMQNDLWVLKILRKFVMRVRKMVFSRRYY